MRNIIILLSFSIILSVYLSWFHIAKTLSSGDWPYLYPENIASFEFITESPFLWLEPYYQITAKLGVQAFSLPWEVTEKIFWFYPFLIISLVSSFIFLKYLTRHLGIDRNSLVFISIGSLIFTTNTYILMLTGGGQMGVAIAYSMTPLVLLIFMKLVGLASSSGRNLKFKISNLKLYFFAVLVLGAQLMFDPRVFLLSIFIAILYFLFIFITTISFNGKAIKRIILILFFSFLINLFWILPNLGFLNAEYKTTVDAVGADFLSFATFSNSISLLHPNWPDNIFGKVGFMKSEFIILTILAYSSLFAISKIKNQKSKIIILFFAFLGLIGAFFAKGTNPPFGELYVSLSSVPGFGIFRDPTKFYVLVVLSYVVLIPFCLWKISEKVSSIKYQVLSIRNTYYIIHATFLLLWLFLIRPAVFGQLSGTFKPHEVPREYLSLKDFLNNQSQSFKTLWIPQAERFGFNSKTYPAISAIEIFEVSSLSGILKRFEMPDIKNKLKEADIRYVIVPYDYLGEMFLIDRKFDYRLYVEAITKLNNVNWLSALENNDFGRIKIFEIIY